jgi:ethanolamine utilization protein EutQ (cupin superfamily)
MDKIFIENNDEIDSLIEGALSVRENGGMVTLEVEAIIDGDTRVVELTIRNEEPFEV